jgi:DNA-directed RNA polymerase specialized sigma24 family protein
MLIAERKPMLFWNDKADQITVPQTVLQRIAQSDKSAIQDCINTYGDLVWAIARSKTDSLEEAEFLSREIFSDIWKYAEKFDSSKCSEIAFVTLIAKHHLIVH